MILAIDTATRWTGLALHDGRSVLAETGWHSTNTHTVELAPSVIGLLRRTDMEPTDLKAIAVAIGPGSYTGLRIGLGFAKGLALANQTRLIGVPTLDILAAALPRSEGILAVVVEAGRTRISAGLYGWHAAKGWLNEEKPTVETWESLLDRIDEPVTFAGEISPAAAKMIRGSAKDMRLVSAADSVRRASYLAQIGWLRLKRGWTDDPDSLSPYYLQDPAGTKPSTG